MSELLIGCGKDLTKKVKFDAVPPVWTDLTTLDIDPTLEPTVVHDLDVLPYPFADASFDEIHAYEVLEHCGKQGDWKFFFAQFSEFYRLLKPGGYFVATVPMWDSPWAWADPGHTRVICRNSLIFLDQNEYKQTGLTAMTDYRAVWKGDFETIGLDEKEHTFAFVLQKR